ncbi:MULTISPECIES: hypothetical protein [unclassified Paludibacterium]|uniref:hypothetical protein n=1 Tax=unclassified Paludibacterium TaxID=2618429 RepID=UPI001C0471A3|nr:hypothetical protein [Paludibacterium sp. B53371]BEV70566.1 hypothetical protein THUN1379_00480 [Paludibacterium sp. THUN1379]
MRSYLDTLDHHRRCLDEAQRDVCRSVADAIDSAMNWREEEWQQHLDGAMVASLAWWQVHADSQREMQRVGEQWLSALHALWLKPWQDPDDPIARAIRLSDVSCGAMAKMTRQVSHFASTRLSAAAVNAAREARRAWLISQGHEPKAGHGGMYYCRPGCGRSK